MQGASMGREGAAVDLGIKFQPALAPGPASREARVLFVHHNASHVRKFQEIVALEAVGLCVARDLQEASQVMAEANPPLVVFTDTKLPDGTWHDTLALARKTAEAVNVVVVSPIGNVSLYTEVVENGAFDFLTPNIAPGDFSPLLRAALGDALARRLSAQP